MYDQSHCPIKQNNWQQAKLMPDDDNYAEDIFLEFFYGLERNDIDASQKTNWQAPAYPMSCFS